MSRGRVVAGTCAVLLLGTSGYVALDAFDKVPGILTLDPVAAPAPSAPVPSGSVSATPTPGTPASGTPASGTPAPGTPAPGTPLPSALPAAVVLPPAGADGPLPVASRLRAVLTPALRDPRLGRSVAVSVRDAVTGSHLLDVSAAIPRTPASTTKLLTALAVLRTLDPATTLTTRAVQGRSASQVVLVAGGDTLLSPGRGLPGGVAGRAGLADLAAQTAAALRAKGVEAVTVQLDDRYAAGPRFAPGWAPVDVAAGLTGPVAALGLSTRRPHAGHAAPPDPAMTTAAAFATALRAAGVKVNGTTVRAAVVAKAVELGRVRSAPVADILTLALRDSDDALTESLARLAAHRAGRSTGFSSVAAWVTASVRAQGIDTTGIRLVDSCGLSHGTRIPAGAVADVLELAARGRVAGLQDVVSELPVAGLSGTLADRFSTASSRAAAGIARAKTGTLTGASSLAGTVVDRDGRLLVFVVLADAVPAGVGTLYARAALDRFVALLAGCGCR